MSNRNRPNAEGKSAPAEKLITENQNIEILNMVKPNPEKKQDIREELKTSEVKEPCKNGNGAVLSKSVPIQTEKGLEIKDLMESMENECLNNNMGKTVFESGIFAKKPVNNNIECDNLYYFKYMVPAGRAPRLPLSGLFKDMLLKAGIRGPDMIRKVPFGPLKDDIYKSLKKSANDKMGNYLRQKVGINEVATPKLNDIFKHFGIKFSNRVVIPKIVTFMSTGFGKLLLKFFRK